MLVQTLLMSLRPCGAVVASLCTTWPLRRREQGLSGETVESPADARDKTMAQSLIIEDESGTYRGSVHPHNGYYAGDFSATDSFISAPRTTEPARLSVVVDLRRNTAAAVAAPIGWSAAA